MEKSSEISTSRSILGSDDEFYDLEEEVTEECEEFEDSEGFEDLESQFSSTSSASTSNEILDEEEHFKWRK